MLLNLEITQPLGKQVNLLIIFRRIRGAGLYYPGDYYFNNTSLSIQSENGDNYLAQGSPNIGYLRCWDME